MELNWSTVILEIVNFLILIWILQRLLYKPVMNAINQRRESIAQQTREAEQLHNEATKLKAQYQSRLSDWEQERQAARDTLKQELAQERAHQLNELQQLLAQEREKAKAAQAHQAAESQRAVEHTALRHGARFAARLLQRAGSADLEGRLLALLIESLDGMPPEEVSRLQSHWGAQPDAVRVSSAYPLSAAQQRVLETALSRITGAQLPVNYAQEPDLLAGLYITVGAWVLRLNLRDELKDFTEFTHVSR